MGYLRIDRVLAARVEPEPRAAEPVKRRRSE